MDYVEEVEGLQEIYLVDTGQFGLNGYGAAYILKSTIPAIIETGLSYSAERILKGLEELEIPPEDVGYIFITHVHLDHAGGAGPLGKACPNATVVVHERGAKHLIKPAYLVNSVKEATGPMFTHYGEAVPIPTAHIFRVEGGELVSLGGGVNIKMIATPGHAPHHLCFYEHRTKTLFVGDAAGIYWPKMEKLLPTTPPPSFDLRQSLTSLKLLQELDLRYLLYTHFGPHEEPARMLQDYAKLLQEWVKGIKYLKRRLKDEGAVKERLVEKYAPLFEGYYDREMIEGEIRMNAAGVLRYLGAFDLGRRGKMG
jgi:glyoxylase-like metal-dependent hydrolase (beta-lactamase superfamily II)